MFCQKCGAQNELNSKFCSVCGNDLSNKIETKDDENTKGIKVLSIVGLVLAFIFPPIGIIFSAIALAKSNKYKKEMGTSSGYTPIAAMGLGFSIFITFIILIIVLVCIGVFSIFKGHDDVLKSTWECKMSPFSTTKVVTATFNDDNFVWAKYGDEKDNYLSGTYYISNREYKDGKNEYTVRFSPNYYIVSGKEKSNYTKSINMDIEFNAKTATIKSSNSTTYYCERVSD